MCIRDSILDVETSTDGSHFTLEGTRYYVPMIGEFNIRNADVYKRQ